MSVLEFSYYDSYLIYVTKFDMFSDNHMCNIIYSYTGDPFHAIGEIYFRSLEKIYSINFVRDTSSRRTYWKKEGIRIFPWYDKY